MKKTVLRLGIITAITLLGMCLSLFVLNDPLSRLFRTNTESTLNQYLAKMSIRAENRTLSAGDKIIIKSFTCPAPLSCDQIEVEIMIFVNKLLRG